MGVTLKYTITNNRWVTFEAYKRPLVHVEHRQHGNTYLFRTTVVFMEVWKLVWSWLLSKLWIWWNQNSTTESTHFYVCNIFKNYFAEFQGEKWNSTYKRDRSWLPLSVVSAAKVFQLGNLDNLCTPEGKRVRDAEPPAFFPFSSAIDECVPLLRHLPPHGFP